MSWGKCTAIASGGNKRREIGRKKKYYLEEGVRWERKYSYKFQFIREKIVLFPPLIKASTDKNFISSTSGINSSGR